MSLLRDRFFPLLVALVVLLVVQPLFHQTAVSMTLLNLLVSTVFIAAIVTLAEDRTRHRVGIALALTSIVSRWLMLWLEDPPVIASVAGLGIQILFLGFVAWVVLEAVLRQRRVSTDTIMGGICVYLLIGVIWALAYGLIESLSPGAFLYLGEPFSEHESVVGELPIFMYFSITTMTTLGYGDVVPVLPFARIVAVMEAVVGQLYLAIFIAGLVGIRMAQSTHRD